MAKVTATAVYEETSFGTLAIARKMNPQVARLFGFESANRQRLFLGRTRVPPARTDLYACLSQYSPNPAQPQLWGLVTVHQVLTLTDGTPEASRLNSYQIHQHSAMATLSGTPTRLFELVTYTPNDELRGVEDHLSDGHSMHRSHSIAELLAVALLNAAG
jgi:hypothetical protein